MFRAFFRRQIEEIQAEPALRGFGFFFSLTVAVAAMNWLHGGVHYKWLSKHVDAVCWPTFASCARSHLFDAAGWKMVFVALAAFAVLVAVAFLFRRAVPWAYAGLIAVSALEFAIVALDYRLRLNQHLISAWVLVFFLFAEKKKASLFLLLPMLYFWPGTWKLDREWLEGAALAYRTPWVMPSSWLPVACAYVAVLELVLVWGLWSKNRWLRGATLAQLVAFHLVSFEFVGFFYPLLMFAIVALVPLVLYREPSFRPFSEWKRDGVPKVALTLFILFTAAQLRPWTLPGDTALTGEGRLFALHMFDALPQCEISVRFKLPDGTTQERDIHRKLAPRIHCDPAVYLSDIRRFCAAGARDGHFVDLDWKLRSRRTTDSHFIDIVRVENACAQRLEYSAWRHNRWILSSTH